MEVVTKSRPILGSFGLPTVRRPLRGIKIGHTTSLPESYLLDVRMGRFSGADLVGSCKDVLKVFVQLRTDLGRLLEEIPVLLKRF